MPADDSKRLKLGVLGVGAAAQWYYLPATRAWSSRLELKAVCDLDADRANHFAQMYESESVFSDSVSSFTRTPTDSATSLRALARG